MALIPCEQKTELPFPERTGAVVESDISPSVIANTWFQAFVKAVESNDTTAICRLFLVDSFWKDILALTPDFRTIHGVSNIKSFLDTSLAPSGLSALTLGQDGVRAPSMDGLLPGLILIICFFTFETKIGRGSGVARLAPAPNNEGWKVYTMYTCLVSLKDFPAKTGINRNPNPQYSGSWEEERMEEKSFVDRKPTVIVIGGGHVGLEVAARLKYLGVPTLVVEQRARIGDNWRLRYKSLCTHDPVWYNTTPLLPFPATWPVYTPAPKLADWLENYAHSLELDVWTSAKVCKAVWRNDTKDWLVEIKRAGNETVLFEVKHLVVATGFGGGTPRVPDFPGKDTFKGTILHSTSFKTAAEHIGKKAVIVGACTSAHDIAQDFSKHGVDVTMCQRSSTHVISTSCIELLLKNIYNEEIPTDHADHISGSLPFAVLLPIYKIVIPQLAGTVDAKVLAGLEKVGFKTNLGIDDTGIIPLVFQRGGGYYIDTGASQSIINGDIKLKSGSDIERFTEKGLRFADGTELEADVVIFATGYGDARESATEILGPEVVAKVGPIWGLDREGQVNGVWKRLGQPGLWWGVGNMATTRFHSSHLALQIKAIEEGLLKL